jgi:hypothetical protein
MKFSLPRATGGNTTPTTHRLRFLTLAKGAPTMTQNNLKWVLISAPDDKGNAQLNIAAHDGGQVAIYVSGSTAAEIADLLIYEMHGPDTYTHQETVH